MIMRVLEDEVRGGDKLIPFLVANDVFELDPEKLKSNVLKMFARLMKYDVLYILSYVLIKM